MESFVSFFTDIFSGSLSEILYFVLPAAIAVMLLAIWILLLVRHCRSRKGGRE